MATKELTMILSLIKKLTPQGRRKLAELLKDI